MNIRSPLSLPDLLSASPDQNVAPPRPTRTRFSRAVSASPDQKTGRSTKTPSPSISPTPSRSTSRSRHVAIRPTYLRLARPLGLPTSRSPDLRVSRPPGLHDLSPLRTTSDHDLRVPSCTNPEYGLQVPPRTTTTSPLGLLRFLLKKESGIGQPHSAQPL